MKYLVWISLFAALLAACGNGVQTAGKKETVAIKAPGPSNNTDSFNISFGRLLTAYYALKDASVNYDTVHMNAASRIVAACAVQLPPASRKAGATGAMNTTAINYATAIHAAATKITGDQELDQKKRDFYVLSEALYNLAKSVQYDRQAIYRQHCPMAFNGEEEGYWLSNSSAIVNPYIGNKHPKYRASMVGCGDVTDSLGYSK